RYRNVTGVQTCALPIFFSIFLNFSTSKKSSNNPCFTSMFSCFKFSISSSFVVFSLFILILILGFRLEFLAISSISLVVFCLDNRSLDRRVGIFFFYFYF